ncbi:MAG: biopolymer transporter ExbD [Cyclobacteriaceae bacterium]|nr:biopolymer transporter ExbD [Cyclobacteriaceae bacterium HetDA_MAG_MS6]
MAKGKNRNPPEVSSGSMADIAFLLLIFFLVTTTIANDKGIAMLLPPPPDESVIQEDIIIPERNLFKILANSKDGLLVENEPYFGTMDELKEEVKKFVLNFGNPTPDGVEVYNSLPPSMKSFINQYGKDPESSDDCTNGKAIVSFKANRGTSYELYIQVLDAVNGAYNEVYAERVGITPEEWLTLDRDDEIQDDMYLRARQGIPRAISIAEPD